MVAPSAYVSVNGTPIPVFGTSGIDVAAGSTITIALVSVAGVETWDVNCTTSDGINAAGQAPQVEATKVLDSTHFTCQFTVPNFQNIGSIAEPWNVGSSLQFVSVVNAGKFNQNSFTFGVYTIGSSTLRLVFNGENLETNIPYGVAPDINEILIGRALGPAGLSGGDLLGYYPNPYVNSISGYPPRSPVTIFAPTLIWDLSPAGSLNATNNGMVINSPAGTLGFGWDPHSGGRTVNDEYTITPNSPWGNTVNITTFGNLSLVTDGYTGTITTKTANIVLDGAVHIPSDGAFSSLTVDTPVATTVFNHGFTVNALTPGPLPTGDAAYFNCNTVFEGGSVWLWYGQMPSAYSIVLPIPDANYTLASTEYNRMFIRLIPQIPLTAPRTLTLPSPTVGTTGFFAVLQNLTTQTLTIAGAGGGAFVTLNAGDSAFVYNDGLGYYAIGGSGGSVTWGSDLAGSTDLNQWVSSISGHSGSGGTVPINALTLQFAANQSFPQINQALNTLIDGYHMVIQAQSSSAGNGGNLVLASGQGLTATDGYVALNVGGSTDGLVLNPSGVVTIHNLSTGVVHSDSSGNLSSSLIVNADVSGSAAIAYSKLNLTNSIVNADINSAAAIAVSKFAIGTADQLLDTNHGATTAEWFTLGGDATFASHNLTVTGIQGNTVTSGALTKGQFFVATSTSNWAATTLSGDVSESATTAGKLTVTGLQGTPVSATAPTNGQVLEYNGTNWIPTTAASGVTWDSDLAGSNNTNQWVAAISGNGGGGGTIPLNITTLQWANGQSSPTINQAALAATNTPAAGQNLTLKAQAGSNALSGNNNGGNGGNLMLASGTAGVHTGSGTDGTVGNIQLQLDSTTNITLTTGMVTWADVGAISYLQTQKAGTGGNVGATWTIQAQQGQQQSGSNNNNNGGNLVLNAGSAGTGGSGTAGTAGNVTIGGNVIALSTTASNVQITYMSSAGVVHNNSTGFLSSSLIVDADVSSSAALAVSKLAIGTADQLLDTNHSATTAEWFTLGGDATFASHNLTVTGIQGNTFTSGAPTKGQFVVATSTSNYGPVTLSGDVSESATTAGLLTVIGLRGTSIDSSVASVGAAQDGYALTWHNASSSWKALQESGGGGGSGITQLTGDVTAGVGSGSQPATIATMQGTNTVTKTANYTINSGSPLDFQIFCNPSSAFNLTLPAPANGMVFHIWDISGTMETNNVTLVRHGSEKISGVAASRVLQTNWGHWMVTTNGTDWFISG